MPKKRKSVARHSIPGSIFKDKEGLAEFLEQYATMDQAKMQQLYEHLIHPTKAIYSSFLDNLDKNRVPIPIPDKRRVKPTLLKEGDTKYVPAMYANLERDEYVIWQAPSKDNYHSFWRSVWQDQSVLILSLSDSFSETDPDKCYPYWPTKENEVMNLQNGRIIISLMKKTGHNGFFSYEFELSCTDEMGSKKTDMSDDGAETVDQKVKTVTLVHYNSWQANTWPNVDSFAACIQTMARKEFQTMRQNVDQSQPPVIIQSYGGVGRGAVAWVSIILMKDAEKKDCFDIPDLIKKFIRIRPGSFSSRLYYMCVFAIGFRCAGLTGWLSEEEVKKLINEIETSYKDVKNTE